MPRPVPLSLALQGGGAHGAFTWGVLDALLDEPRIAIDAVAGCSAGAMNAVAMAQGWMENGRAGARHALQRFWGAVADSQPAVLSQVSADGLQAEPSALLRMMLLWARPLSPREANPFGVDPLREIVAAQVDFAALRQRCPWPLAIATTQALSGRLRVFQAHEISADVLLASACLPRWHHPVQVQGEPHWDGGYAANPPLWPLLECSRGADWLLVPLLPLSRRPLPQTAREIEARIAELGFTAPLHAELRTLLRLQQRLQGSWWVLDPLLRRLRRLRLHLVDGEPALAGLAADSRLVVDRRFLQALRAQGQSAALAWLRVNGSDIGRRATADPRLLPL
jgi:NTE family protein